jgi:hypothetical protein
VEFRTESAQENMTYRQQSRELGAGLTPGGRKIRIGHSGAACYVIKESLVAFRRSRHARAMKTAIDQRVGVGGFNVSLRSLAWGLGCLGLVLRAGAAAEVGTRDESFKLREVSVFEQGQDSFLRGQSGECEDKPSPKVKAYPAFVSKKPIYGSIHFYLNRKQPNSAQIAYFAVDESQGTGKGYDRLYFDADGDLDLRNDPVIKPQGHPPDNARLNYGGIKAQVIFDFLAVKFDFGPAGIRPVQLMPRLTISVYEKEEYKQMSFVRTRLYTGDIEIGGEMYEARLSADFAPFTLPQRLGWRFDNVAGRPFG